jgi:hydrogenase nickel incorporation protein HypB
MKRVVAEQKVQKENDRIAAELRSRFEDHGVFVVNLIGSPGAGKTALLENTLVRLGDDLRIAVLTGDIETDNDAARLAPFGHHVRQITTGGSCHLNAQMVKHGLDQLDAEPLDYLFVENVGNLVCPAGFDLGEASKIVVLSVTEGDDKPIKYPTIFIKSDLLIINKIDLLPYVPFEVSRAREHAQRVHPGIETIEVSCATGQGIDGWIHWLSNHHRALRLPAERSPAPER